MPWKPDQGVTGRIAEELVLQFGHGCDAVETGEPTMTPDEIKAPSIRPRL